MKRRSPFFRIVCETYLTNVVSNLRDRKTIAGRFKNHILPVFGEMTLGEITSQGVAEFLNKKRDEGYKPKTLTHMRADVFAIFAFASNQHPKLYDGPNPVAFVPRPIIPPKAIGYLLPAEIRRLLPKVTGRWRTLFATAIYCGLRKGELFGLRKENLDLRTGLIHVVNSYGNTTKAAKIRFVPIPKELKPLLTVQIRAHDGPLVFPSAKGGMQVGNNIHLPKILRAALKRAGVSKYLRFHDLRCTYGTLAYEQTGDIRFVQEVLGHADPGLTERVYSAFRTERLVRMGRKLTVNG